MASPKGSQAKYSFAPKMNARRAILLEIVRANPGKTSEEVFKLWFRSQARKDAKLPGVHTENDLETMEKMGVLYSQKGTVTHTVRLMKKWYVSQN